MEIKIYIDVLLLMNTLFNYLLLRMTGWLLHKEVSALRLFITATLGSLYAVLIFFLPTSFIYSITGRMLTGLLMVLLAFTPKNLKTAIQCILLFYVSVFTLGGGAFCLFHYTGINNLPGILCRNGSVYINIPVYLLLILCGLSSLLLKTAFLVGTRLAAIHKQIIPIRIVLGKRFVRLQGLYDSGNLLLDQQNRGIIIVQWNSLKPLFPYANNPRDIRRPTNEIPCRTLQGKLYIKTFQPDAVFKEEKRRLIPLETYTVAITEEILDYYHNWDAILPRDFEGVDHNHEANTVKKTHRLFKNTKATIF